MLRGRLHTVFGWDLHVGQESNPRSLANFPMQANGAEMLRLAACLVTEHGLDVCAPVHDSLVVEGPVSGIEAVAEATQAAMAEASEIVLSGFGLRTSVQVVSYPGRYTDPRGVEMWARVMALLEEPTPKVVAPAQQLHPGPAKSCSADAHPVVAPAQQELWRRRPPAQSYVLSKSL